VKELQARGDEVSERIVILSEPSADRTDITERLELNSQHRRS
jgi:hypothetical protein